LNQGKKRKLSILLTQDWERIWPGGSFLLTKGEKQLRIKKRRKALMEEKIEKGFQWKGCPSRKIRRGRGVT